MWPLATRPAVAAIVVLTAALMLPVCAARAIAQANTGEVGGIVRDHSGGALVGAAVVARHGESGAVVQRTTDAEGRFFLPALRIGAWDITASLDRLRAADAQRHRARARPHARRSTSR